MPGNSQEVKSTFGCSRSAVLLKDDATNELVIAAVRGWTINYHVKGERFKIGAYSMVGHAGETGETYHAPDVAVDPYCQIGEASTRSEFDIPLKVHGQLIAVFDFQHHELNAFPLSQIKLPDALAGHITTAIENAPLFQREHQEKQRKAREMNKTRRAQLALFPSQAAALAGFEVTVQTCRTIARQHNWRCKLAHTLATDGRIPCKTALPLLFSKNFGGVS